jgi:hypothetical protein
MNASAVAVVAVAVAAGALTGCTTFGTVRSAEVRPGLQGGAQVAATSAVGPIAGWFWADECDPASCDRSVAGLDVNVAYGRRPRTGRPFTLGAGVNGFYPYAEGYVELGTLGRAPVGVGARLGIPFFNWSEHSVYGRVDVPLSRSARLLYNPGWMLHVGESPNGATKGTFNGLVQGLGVELDLGNVSVVPSAGYVLGRAHHGGYGTLYGPETHGFGWIAVGVHAHRARPRP